MLSRFFGPNGHSPRHSRPTRKSRRDLSRSKRRCILQNERHEPGDQAPENTRIAIGLFGLLRHNSTVANVEKFLLDPLLRHRGDKYTADVFLHVNVARIVRPRRASRATSALGDAVLGANGYRSVSTWWFGS